MAKRKEDAKLMDARALTKIVMQFSNDIIDLKKEVNYINQQLQKLRVVVADLQIDVKMMEVNKNGKVGAAGDHSAD